MSDTSAQGGGVGVIGLLGVAFIVLKLCGVIDWSWWWVLAPFWGTFALLVLVLIVALCIEAVSMKSLPKRRR